MEGDAPKDGPRLQTISPPPPRFVPGWIPIRSVLSVPNVISNKQPFAFQVIQPRPCDTTTLRGSVASSCFRQGNQLSFVCHKSTHKDASFTFCPKIGVGLPGCAAKLALHQRVLILKQSLCQLKQRKKRASANGKLSRQAAPPPPPAPGPSCAMQTTSLTRTKPAGLPLRVSVGVGSD